MLVLLIFKQKVTVEQRIVGSKISQSGFKYKKRQSYELIQGRSSIQAKRIEKANQIHLGLHQIMT